MSAWVGITRIKCHSRLRTQNEFAWRNSSYTYDWSYAVLVVLILLVPCHPHHPRLMPSRGPDTILKFYGKICKKCKLCKSPIFALVFPVSEIKKWFDLV